jgi:hypothetical protein
MSATAHPSEHKVPACVGCGEPITRAALKRSKKVPEYCSRACLRAAPHYYKTCCECGKKFRRAGSRVGKRIFCSQSCFHKANGGANNYHWGGGRSVGTAGYVNISLGNGRMRREHILIAERVLGRRLKKNEVVHHINGDKTDNAHDNLLICTNGYHRWLHHRMSELYQREHFARAVSYSTSL